MKSRMTRLGTDQRLSVPVSWPRTWIHKTYANTKKWQIATRCRIRLQLKINTRALPTTKRAAHAAEHRQLFCKTWETLDKIGPELGNTMRLLQAGEIQ